MTPETIAELRRLYEAATPGMWTKEAWLDIFKAMVQRDIRDSRDQEIHNRLVAMLLTWPDEQCAVDAEFISSAHNNFSALLDAAEQLARIQQAAQADAADFSTPDETSHCRKSWLIK